MNTALPESQYLFQNILSDKQRSLTEQILNEINTNTEAYSTVLLWEVDKQIGGVGGYCMPSDPKRNPFPGGEERKLFRPLQYARSEIDINNVYLSARYVIEYSGMHLEAVSKLVLANKKLLGSIRYTNATLGKITRELKNIGSIPDDLIDGLFYFVKLFNKSKHEVNHDEERERLFMPADAIVGYLSARILGVELLEIIDHDSTKGIYDIDKSTYKGLF